MKNTTLPCSGGFIFLLCQFFLLIINNNSFSKTPPSIPVCGISGNTSICMGTSTQYCANGGMSAYLWNTGKSTQCITVTTAGTYTVTVTDVFGATSSCSKSLIVNSVSTCAITGSNSICSGSSTQWCAPAGMTGYLWNTGATTQCITISTANTFTVTVTNSNGCTSSCNKTLSINSPPTCSITGNPSVCSGFSTQWCAPAAMQGYFWSTGATTQCITISSAGAYTCTLTNSNGCTSSCSRSLTVNPNPSCSITGNSSVCSGSSTQWCAPTGNSYLWSTGATIQCITVSSAGIRTVTVTNGNGCTSNCNKTLTVNPLPSCAVTGNASICSGSSTQWCAPAGMAGYLWNTGATTQCITISTANTFTVTVTNSNGCTSSCNKTLSINSPPTCSITGNPSVCSGFSTQWCAPAAMQGYFWSTGATTQCITISSAGAYTCTLTNSNGCTSSCSRSLTVNPNPSCSITGNSSVCSGSSTQWCAPTGNSYLWSTGATIQCITVSSAGIRTVTVTNGNGCSSNCNKTLTVNPLPSCAVTGNASICSGSSTQWCAPAGMAGYLWSTGATTQCITVSFANTFTVTVSNGNGCTSSCNKTLNIISLPTCSISGSNICSGSPTQLCAATNAGYLWSTGATTQCITTATAGIYTVTVTNTNGCSSSCSKTVTSGTTPTCAITGNASVCSGSSTQWCAPAGNSYLWSSGATTQCINVSSAGNYTVTLTNTAGCTSSCSKSLTVSGSCTISGNDICTGSPSQLCAPVNTSYQWNTGATTQCIAINSAGNYTLTVTTGSCTNVCSRLITSGICNFSVHTKSYIEGFYLSGGLMQAGIDPVIHPTLCDTVKLELHSTTSPFGLMYSDRKVMTTTGDCNFSFTTSGGSQQYYLVMKHRNTIETWSSNPVTIQTNTNYDFTNNQNKAFGNNMIRTSDNQHWAFFSGDISSASGIGIQDGIVESADYSDVENAVSGVLLGYRFEDITGDKVVESSDYSIVENNVFMVIFSARP